MTTTTTRIIILPYKLRRKNRGARALFGTTVIARCNNVLCFDLDQRRQPSVSIFGDFLPSNESADSTAEVVHIDASLIRANVSWDSLVERHVEDVLSENQSEEEIEGDKKGRQSGKYKKVCTTDPDATHRFAISDANALRTSD
jgi:hypothetical protein